MFVLFQFWIELSSVFGTLFWLPVVFNKWEESSKVEVNPIGTKLSLTLGGTKTTWILYMDGLKSQKEAKSMRVKNQINYLISMLIK